MRSNLAIPLIIVAVLAWGLLHAIGAYTYNHNPLRFWMVLGCEFAFVGFWLAMLAARRARLKREGHGQRWGRPGK
ncbi:MAG TPA: hypothetical protein VHV55_06825 [Pirellulales bacterium]|jgi:hypothetical protein|nr:hypothetical protein [Pirellulales bacterium]